jgi:hypothetical protein
MSGLVSNLLRQTSATYSELAVIHFLTHSQITSQATYLIRHGEILYDILDYLRLRGVTSSRLHGAQRNW